MRGAADEDGQVVWKDGYVLIVHKHVSAMSDVMRRILEASAQFESGAPPRLLVDARYYRPIWEENENPQIAGEVLTRFPPDIRIAVWLRSAGTAAKVAGVIDRLGEAGLEIRRFEVELHALDWLLGEAE